MFKFLKTFEDYDVEQCLSLCQEYGIIHASVFLLESRLGDVGSALMLTLSGPSGKFIVLDIAPGRVIYDASVGHYSTLVKAKEVTVIHRILHACVGLCQHNTHRLDHEKSDPFNCLNRFVSLYWIPVLVNLFRKEIPMVAIWLNQLVHEEIKRHL